MHRHHSAPGHGRPPRHSREGDADRGPAHVRHPEGAREPGAGDDPWRKHPRASLDSELALVPLWRRTPSGR